MYPHFRIMKSGRQPAHSSLRCRSSAVFPFLGHCPSFSAHSHFWGIAPAFPPNSHFLVIAPALLHSSVSGAIQLMPKKLKFWQATLKGPTALSDGPFNSLLGTIRPQSPELVNKKFQLIKIISFYFWRICWCFYVMVSLSVLSVLPVLDCIPRSEQKEFLDCYS